MKERRDEKTIKNTLTKCALFLLFKKGERKNNIQREEIKLLQ